MPMPPRGLFTVVVAFLGIGSHPVRSDDLVPHLDPRVAGAMKEWKHGDKEGRLKAVRRLGRLGHRSGPVVTELICGLSDPTAEIRAATAETFGKLGPDAGAANLALIAALGDRDRTVRTAAAMALTRTRPDPEQALPALTAALHADPAGIPGVGHRVAGGHGRAGNLRGGPAPQRGRPQAASRRCPGPGQAWPDGQSRDTGLDRGPAPAGAGDPRAGRRGARGHRRAGRRAARSGPRRSRSQGPHRFRTGPGKPGRSGQPGHPCPDRRPGKARTLPRPVPREGEHVEDESDSPEPRPSAYQAALAVIGRASLPRIPATAREFGSEGTRASGTDDRPPGRSRKVRRSAPDRAAWPFRHPGGSHIGPGENRASPHGPQSRC